MRRVSIVGTSGSGKTTLGRRVAGIIGAPFIEMDALHWDANWTEAPPDLLRARVEPAIAGEAWVCDGGYQGKIGTMVWEAADTVVWLDYAFPRIIWRLTKRTFGRAFTREKLWNDNQETFRGVFFSKDSLYVWVVRTHWRNRRKNPERLALPQCAHLRVVRLRTPRETERWLRSVASAVR